MQNVRKKYFFFLKPGPGEMHKVLFVFFLAIFLAYTSSQQLTVNDIFGTWQSIGCELVTVTQGISVYVFRTVTFSNTTFEAFFDIHISDCTVTTLGSTIHAISDYSLGTYNGSFFAATPVNGNFTIKTQLFDSNSYGSIITGGYALNPCWASYYNTTVVSKLYDIINVLCPSLSLIACLNGYGDWANISNSQLYLGVQNNHTNCVGDPRPCALGPPLIRPPPPTPAPTPAPLAPTPPPTPVPTPSNFGVSVTPSIIIAIFSALLCALS